MMPEVVFDTIMSVRILFIRAFGSKLRKLLLRIAENYYKLLSENLIHEDALAKIIKEEYLGDKQKIDKCTYFIYNRKQTIDTIYESKYGRSGRFMSQLFKLIQKVYLDSCYNDENQITKEELNNSMKDLNKDFNKVVLYVYSKYN